MKHTIKKAVAVAVLAGLCIVAIFTFTNPETIPSAVLLLIFALLYCFVVSSLLTVLLILRRLSLLAVSTKALRRIAYTLGGFAVFIVVLRSIGQLTVRDIAIAALFTVLLYLYYTRLRATAQDSE